MPEDAALNDFKYLALRICADQGADCTNPAYEKWEKEFHHCRYEEAQADPENTQDDFCEA